MGVSEHFRTLCRHEKYPYRYRPRMKYFIRGFFVRHPSILRNLHVLFILVAVSLDPLFFYIPVVNNNSNCLGLDNTLRIIVVVFRTLVDGVYIVLWWFHKLAFLHKRTYQDVLSFIAAILAVLPLPQVIVYAVSWRLLTIKLIKFVVVIQFIPRVYLIIPTYNYARIRFHGSLNMWFAAAFYLFMFILASNVLGAFWYLRAIERNMDCWRKACRTRGLCGVSSFYCNGSSSNNKYLDEFCPILPASNSTFFDYGLYLGAFQREIMSIHTNFLDKFFYCIWWGLQSLSSLGQNLEPGSYIWDNFFAVFIVISGLVLLALLIGNMQLYLQNQTTELDKDRIATGKKMAQIREELNLWHPIHTIPQDMRRAIATCENEKWLRTSEINLESLLNNTPYPLRRYIRLELCRRLFSKVKNFQQLHPVIKRELRERAKGVVFQERSIIHQEGYPIYQMIEIVDGNALAFSRDNNNKKEGSQMYSYNLEIGDSTGEELLDKALQSLEPNLPLAGETVQAMTKVEAFTLSFRDFLIVFTRNGNLLVSDKEEWAANVIAAAFRKRFSVETRTLPREARTGKTDTTGKEKNDHHVILSRRLESNA